MPRPPAYKRTHHLLAKGTVQFRKVRHNVYLPPWLADQVRKHALDTKLSFSAALVDMLEDYKPAKKTQC